MKRIIVMLLAAILLLGTLPAALGEAVENLASKLA